MTDVYLVSQGDYHEGGFVLSLHKTREGALAAVEKVLEDNRQYVALYAEAPMPYRKIKPTDLLYVKKSDAEDSWTNGITYLQIQKRSVEE